MPSPNDARKASAKKTPEKKVDLGPKLAKRRSQDFTSKIQGWNQAGGGVVQQQDEIIVIEDSETQSAIANDDEVQIVVETETVVPESEIAAAPATIDITPKVPVPPPAAPAQETSQTPGTKKAGREVDLNRGAWVRRKSKPQIETTAAPPVKHAGTPKKRVVSDGHWRRDRQVKEEETPTKEKERTLTPKPIVIRKSVANVGLKVPVSHQEFSESASEVEPEPTRIRPLRDTRSRSNSRSADSRDATPDYETSGTKVYIKRRRRQNDPKDPRKSDSSLTAPSSVDKPSSATEITTPSESSRKEVTRRLASEPRRHLRKADEDEKERPRSARRPNEVEDSSRVPSDSRKMPTAEERKRSLRMSRSAEAYAKQITEHIKKPSTPPVASTAPKLHGTRIEGWLANMPDPFTESRRSSLTPEPLSISKRKTARRPDRGSESDSGKENRRSSGRRRSSRKDIDQTSANVSERYLANEYADESPSGPATLRRSGARRKSISPVKNRDSRESTPTNFDALISGALPSTSIGTSRNSSAAHDKRPRISSGGQPLSKIISTDTRPTRDDPQRRHPLSRYEDAESTIEGSVLSRASDGDSPLRRNSRLKRRGTKKHADLMSVLSQDDTHTIVSRRSVRASRRKADLSSIGEIMNDLSTDELKYQRELRTLVDGVIPVLLQHALSRSESTTRARVFSSPTSDTKPIVDMGIALEKLKNTHRRIPMHEPSELLTWAENASKVYADYLRTWRLGFKNIVVNLAPAEESTTNKTPPAWADGVPRNKDGDLTNAAGERVDVAYLLKRPLVRLKYLAKTFRSLSQMQPSARTEDMTTRYEGLISDAKKRVNDEEARLEDEAAASIDAKRARDPRSLAPITGVTVDPTRSVRARDYFDMDLVHSSGQQIGCKIEIIYRDDAPNRGKSGDLLFCEISESGRWLLFPPLPISLVTAREGDRPGQMVVMIRGFLSNARQWREVMSLRAEDGQTSNDWTDMLGSSPMPPKLTRRSSFNMFKEIGVPAPDPVEPKAEPRVILDDRSRDPSLREVEVPLGEQAQGASRIWDGSEVNSVYNDEEATDLGTAEPKRYRNNASQPSSPGGPHRSSRESATQPEYFYEQPRHNRYSGQFDRRPVASHTRSKSEWTGSTITSTTDSYSVWLPSEDMYSDHSSDEDDILERKPSTRPGMHQRTSSVPSTSMPTIPKMRHSEQSVPARPESPLSDRDLLPSQRRRATERASFAEEPASAPPKLQKRRLSMLRPKDKGPYAEPAGPLSLNKQPSPPGQSKARPTSLGLKTGILPSFTPAFLKKDRPSSPLKHEYEPSSASDSLSDSELSELDDIDSYTSESIVEEEIVSTIGDLKGFQQYNTREFRPLPTPQSPPVTSDGSLRPSESASQSPYRTVPPATMEPAKTVASIFSWSERGTWDSLHPEECQVFVTPGLIEAFDLTQANAAPMTGDAERGVTPSSRGVKPLVALELTPLVPLRRGTAVDISIRSPPTSNSLIRTGNNVMFRSRSPEECERLYALINRARIDNPTYIALQNARGPVKQSNWGEIMDQRNHARTSSGGSKSWWSLGSKRSNSYRSKGSRTASVAATESSVGTMNSAFSALRRFSGGSRIFDIAKSTITSREGTRSTNSESLSSGTATPVPFDPRMGTPLGITNTKVRLYIRDSPSKWRDMGAGRLTVLLPPRQDPTVAANPKATGLVKRIVINGKNKSEVLLDVTLGESAFERVARTGIAVSAYEESEHIGASGGVLVAKTTVYMIQMKSERDAAYTFGLVGKLRY